MPTCIGIDVGFSADRDTLGIACNTEILPAGDDVLEFVRVGGRGSVWCKQWNLAAAVTWLTGLRDEGQLENAIIVLDGPLAGIKPPTTARFVDGACSGGSFQRRCPAQSVNAGNGPSFVTATYVLAFAATGRLSGESYRMTPGLVPGLAAAQLFETHPTIGMALSLQMVADPDVLPTREGGAVTHPQCQRRCPAKSDWYWYDGAKDRVAQVLGIPELSNPDSIERAGLTPHETQAGLFCLAVAMQIAQCAADNTQAFTIGDPRTGVYHLLGPFHRDWQDEINRVGLVTPGQHGAPVVDQAEGDDRQPHAHAAIPEGAAGAGQGVQEAPLNLVTCGPQCLLHGQPFGVKQCPYCLNAGVPWIKPNQETWGGIDAHVLHDCEHAPENLDYRQFKSGICRQHWPRHG